MYEELFVHRLTSLRRQKNVSAREMSLAIGQNDSYINRIENGKTFPSMQVFFYICEYLNVTPQEFFDEGIAAPSCLNEITKTLGKFDSDQLEAILAFIKRVR